MTNQTLETVAQEAETVEPRAEAVEPQPVQEQVKANTQDTSDLVETVKKEEVKQKKGLFTRLTEKLKYVSYGAALNDAYNLIVGTAAEVATYVSAVVIGAKTAIEAPGVLGHIYKTGKEKGAKRLITRMIYGTVCNSLDLAVYAATKAVGIAVPVAGPIIEANSFKRLNERKASKAVSWLGSKLKGAVKYVAGGAYNAGKRAYSRIVNGKEPVQPVPQPVAANAQPKPVAEVAPEKVVYAPAKAAPNTKAA